MPPAYEAIGMITGEEWEAIGKQVVQFPELPDAALDIIRQPLSEVVLRSSVENAEKAIDQSYLDFLQQQISLNARGGKWSSLLEKRRQALEPYVGEILCFLSLNSSSWSLWIRYEPSSLHTVWIEYFDKQ